MSILLLHPRCSMIRLFGGTANYQPESYTSGFHLPLQRIISSRLLSMPDVASTSADAPVCYNDDTFTCLGNRALPDDNHCGNYMRLCGIFLWQTSH
jgi:hypothetical protein